MENKIPLEFVEPITYHGRSVLKVTKAMEKILQSEGGHLFRTLSDWTVYKKTILHVTKNHRTYYLTTLCLPANTLLYASNHMYWKEEDSLGKCRAERAVVLSHEPLQCLSDDGLHSYCNSHPLPRSTCSMCHSYCKSHALPTITRSMWDSLFTYTIGETVVPSEAFDSEDAVCSSGIHFFDSKEQASDY